MREERRKGKKNLGNQILGNKNFLVTISVGAHQALLFPKKARDYETQKGYWKSQIIVMLSAYYTSGPCRSLEITV